MSEHTTSRERTISDYAAILRRRKWLVLQAVILLPIAAYLFAANQPKQYSSSADVLLTGSVDNATSALNTDINGIVQTQTQIASTPEMAQRVINASHVTTRSAGQILGELGISQIGSSDVLRFSITDADPVIANLLANAYANGYTTYRRALDTSFIQQSRKELDARINALKSSGDTSSDLYKSLVQKDQQLLTIQTLETASAIVIKTSDGAVQVAPKPKRDAILGLIVGLLLGVTLALLREALDTRLRTGKEISEALGQPLLGRIPAPPKRLPEGQLITLAEPTSPDAEAFRLLRSNIDFAAIGRESKVIMITSALQGEGKSTTASNLAATIARSGQSCVLVDLDLRRPAIRRMFDIDTEMGLTTVALGRHTLDEVFVRMPVLSGEESMTLSTNGNGHAPDAHVLHLLPSGPLPPDPGEFVRTGAVHTILETLREWFDVVIVDTPPLLGVGDAASLSAHVDAIVLLARIGVAKRPVIRETHRIIEQMPTPILGFVLTGAEREESYAYGRYGYEYYYTSQPKPDKKRLFARS